MSHFPSFLHCHGLGAKGLTLSFSDLRSRKLSLLLPQSVLRRWFFAVFAFLHDRYTMLWQVRRLAVCLTISATHWQTRCVRTQIHSSEEIHSKQTNTFALFFFLFWKCLEVAPNNFGFPCADVCSGTAMVGEWKHRKHRASRRKHRLLSASIETEKTERPWPLLVTASVSGLLYSSMGIFNNISLRAIREGAYYMLFWNFLCVGVWPPILHDQVPRIIFS